jgi:hypothetical protein
MIVAALDVFSGVLISPSRAFEQIRDKRPLTLALFTAISVAIVSGLVLVPNPPELAEVILDLPTGTLSLFATLPIWMLLFMTVLTVQATFLHILAMVFKNKGDYLSMLCGLCFAYLPGLLTAPLAALRAALSSESGNTSYQIAFAVICLWVFLLGILAVQRNYRMTLAKAATACTMAVIVLVIFPAVLAVLIMSLL